MPPALMRPSHGQRSCVDPGLDTLHTMLEHHRQPLLSRRAFLARQLRFLGFALFFVGISLAIGVAGYMHFARFTFVDAFLNASMILGGMGPIGELPNDAAKVFASCYALYSGIALLTTVAVLLAPLVHRMLHALHLDDNDHT
jgi:hypothetical protein